jgi:hypothetical protein
MALRFLSRPGPGTLDICPGGISRSRPS